MHNSKTNRKIFRTITAATSIAAVAFVLFVFAQHTFAAANDAPQDVLQALNQANQANQDLASAYLDDKPNKAASHAQDGLREVLKAYNLLLEASQDANNSSLAADAAAMLAVYNQMNTDISAGNYLAALHDSQQAQAIANKAVQDAT